MNMRHNAEVLDQRVDKLEDKGAFRQPIRGVTKNFRRGGDAKWGPMQKLDKVEGSSVVAKDGSRVDIKLIQAVPLSSDEPVAVVESAKTIRIKEQLFPMMEALHEWLGTKEVSLKNVGAHLLRTGPWGKIDGQDVGFNALLKS